MEPREKKKLTLREPECEEVDLTHLEEGYDPSLKRLGDLLYLPVGNSTCCTS